MAKRSREDDELSESDTTTDTAVAVTHFTSTNPASSKIQQLDSDSPDSSGEALQEIQMKCSLPPHKETLSFPDLESFEVHYRKTHLNRCMECRKNLPTDHFLNLHIEENHDAIVSIRKERGEKTVSSHYPPLDIL